MSPRQIRVRNEAKRSETRAVTNGHRTLRRNRTFPSDRAAASCGSITKSCFKMGRLWLLFLSGLLVAQLGESHVVLTFPPARKYALDFLDNFKLPKTPCGMPKGVGPYTSILSGSTFNITWDLAYPHKGGYKLEVLDSQERPLMDLTPIVGGSRFLSFDTTAQSHRVKIPNDYECQGCTIRLLRQAEDWTQNYMFKSCADVDILKGNYNENCMGNGVFKDNRCECNRLFTGPRCQYQDECWDDSDCGSHGHCINIQGTNYPKRQCFCKLGWFGNKCEKESSIKTTELNLKQYSRKDLSMDFKLYWKILKDSNEIEVVLRSRGTSYVALGWRPTSLSAECKAFPPLTFPTAQMDTYTDVRKGKELSDSKESGNILPKPDGKSMMQVTETSSTKPSSMNPVTSTSVTETVSEIVNSTNPTMAETSLIAESSETPMFSPSTSPIPVSVITETTTTPTTTTSTSTSTTTTTTTTTTIPTTTTTTTTTTTEAPTVSTKQTPQFSVPLTVSPVRRLHSRLSTTQTPATTTKASPDELSSSSNVKSTITLEGQETMAISVKQTNKVTTTTQRNLFPSRRPPLLHQRSSRRPAQTTTTTTTTEQPTTVIYEDEEYEEELEGRSPEIQDETELSVEASTTSPVSSKSTAETSHSESVASEREEVTVIGSDDNSFGDSDGVGSHEMEHSFGVEVKSYSSVDSEGDDSFTRTKRTILKRDTKSLQDFPGSNPYIPVGDFHAMDCTDMVIGSARGNLSRIADYYSRDSSTPHMDSFWGGKDSLTLAAGFELDDMTTIVFRKKLSAGEEKSDHSIVDELMHVIWARGQEQGKLIHKPPSGVESGDALPDFYKPDELKYHGQGNQRGKTEVNFFQENIPVESRTFHCRGEWSHPSNCLQEDCEYKASWELLPGNEDIRFTVFTKHSDKWTGIAFSQDTRMNNTDAVIGWVDEKGSHFLMDTWITGYQNPILDGIQNIMNESGMRNSSGTTLVFTRKRDTDDKFQDLAFTDSECHYMIFPFQGGSYNPINKKIKMHETPPLISEEKICIRSCQDSHMPGDTVEHHTVAVRTSTELNAISSVKPHSTSTVDSRPKYQVAIKILKTQNLEDAAQGDILNILKETIKKEVTEVLHNATGFQEVEVIDLIKDDESPALIAKMNVAVDELSLNEVEDKGYDIETMINSSVSSGQIGSLSVKADYLVLSYPEGYFREKNLDITPPETETVRRKNEHLIAVYAITAAVIALGILVIIQIICTVHRRQKAKHTRTSKERLITNSGWKDYSTTASSNYSYEPFADDDPASKVSKNPIGSMGGTNLRGNGLINGSTRGGYGPNFTDTRSLSRNPRMNDGERIHYSRRSESLPRPAPPNPHPAFSGNGYATHDRAYRHPNTNMRSPTELQPDFYFMPSQRRYSGEVVRVYVDYNNPNYTGK